MKISVVIPVLHEDRQIRGILRSLISVGWAASYEVIVVDGDPSGETIKQIRDPGIITMTAGRGRARQMNAGAAKASGDILLFLHADTLLPEGAFVTMTP